MCIQQLGYFLMSEFMWNQMASVIIELKWCCRNGLEKALVNEELYTGFMAANKRKIALLSLRQLFSLLLGKDNFHQIALLSSLFSLIRSMVAGLFLFTTWRDNKLHFLDFLCKYCKPPAYLQIILLQCSKKTIKSTCCQDMFEWCMPFENDDNNSSKDCFCEYDNNQSKNTFV